MKKYILALHIANEEHCKYFYDVDAVEIVEILKQFEDKLLTYRICG